VTLHAPESRARPGRPRSERAHRAVLEAAADLLLEGGLGAATIEAIAARAGVSKVTIYKWWPTRGAVAVEAYFYRYHQTMDFQDTGDLASDLRAQIAGVLKAFRGRAGAVMAALIGEAQSDPDLAETLRASWIEPRRVASATVVQRAIDRGEVRADVDVQLLLDQIYGPIYFRLLLGHQPLDDSLALSLVRTALDGVRA